MPEYICEMAADVSRTPLSQTLSIFLTYEELLFSYL